MDLTTLPLILSVYYPLLAVFGVPANILTIVILSNGKCSLSKCITYYMVAMAVADLMVLIFDVLLYKIKEIYFPKSFLDYSQTCSLKITFSFISTDCSVWLTVAFSVDRFISICCQKLRTKYCTAHTSVVVIAVICGLSALQNFPTYVMNEPGQIIDSTPWFCVLKATFYTLPSWIAYLWLETILTPFAAFFLILLFNSLTIRHILVTSKARRDFRSSSNDPEVENRRKSIILLIAISGNFIFLWMLISVCQIFVQTTQNEFYNTDYSDSFTVAEQVGYMLQLLSSCTNTVIYGVAQTKFRSELKEMIKYPFALPIKLIKARYSRRWNGLLS
ncbi:probable G-protein coupled receptor 139 [Rhincodon typus]|uniref:probable G-protein coupled receptor 139 n=1 Tax=Rhincodon typus TaxID=259920 RepID=UPI002030D9C0|nr:probable G-protein coupled receptor 139 [Rhincodon typus]